VKRQLVALALSLILLFSAADTVVAAEGKKTTGKKKILVVLVDFQDRKGKYQPEDFAEMLFSTQQRSEKYTGSFRGYYREVSAGKLDIDGDVIGWYTAPQKHDYYSTDEDCKNLRSYINLGVYVHEYGHALGLPDLYDLDGSSNGLGDWDVMSSGSWLGKNKLGDSPPLMSAPLRVKMNWTNVIELNQSARNIPIVDITKSNTAYKLVGEKKHEYWMVELVQKGNTSSFNELVPASGLKITHVNETELTNNNEFGSMFISLEQADGFNDLQYGINFGDWHDTYKISCLGLWKPEFTTTSNPNSSYYDGTPSGINLYNISKLDNAKITFDLEFNKTYQSNSESSLGKLNDTFKINTTVFEVRKTAKIKLEQAFTGLEWIIAHLPSLEIKAAGLLGSFSNNFSNCWSSFRNLLGV